MQCFNLDTSLSHVVSWFTTGNNKAQIYEQNYAFNKSDDIYLMMKKSNYNLIT